VGNLLREQLCLALDVDNQFIAKELVQELSDYVGIFKIGFQLFVAEGPQIISTIRNSGSEIFLDLKFHDIPNTVAEVSKVVTGLGVSMFNIHAMGGIDMMTAAVKAASSEAKHIRVEKPKILAVTLLTSLDEYALKDQLKIKDTVQDYVAHLALLAKKSGIDGVIASPQEIGLIRSTCGPNFIIGTPGIRMPDSPPDDQKRTLTPKQAIDAGATFIIVGRPIRNAKDPVMAAKEILSELE
jgi:orotidine-5'-phosphate decarboxylase